MANTTITTNILAKLCTWELINALEQIGREPRSSGRKRRINIGHDIEIRSDLFAAPVNEIVDEVIAPAMREFAEKIPDGVFHEMNTPAGVPANKAGSRGVIIAVAALPHAFSDDTYTFRVLAAIHPN